MISQKYEVPQHTNLTGWEYQVVAKLWRNWNSDAFLVGVQDGSATVLEKTIL